MSLPRGLLLSLLLALIACADSPWTTPMVATDGRAWVHETKQRMNELTPDQRQRLAEALQIILADHEARREEMRVAAEADLSQAGKKDPASGNRQSARNRFLKEPYFQLYDQCNCKSPKEIVEMVGPRVRRTSAAGPIQPPTVQSLDELGGARIVRGSFYEEAIMAIVTEDCESNLGIGPTGDVILFNLSVPPPSVTKRVLPEYPKEARSRGLGGEVVMDLSLDEEGSVTDARVVRTDDPVFNDASLKAAMQWHFQPATHCGKKVKSIYIVRFAFSPNHSSPPHSGPRTQLGGSAWLK